MTLQEEIVQDAGNEIGAPLVSEQKMICLAGLACVVVYCLTHSLAVCSPLERAAGRYDQHELPSPQRLVSVLLPPLPCSLHTPLATSLFPPLSSPCVPARPSTFAETALLGLIHACEAMYLEPANS